MKAPTISRRRFLQVSGGAELAGLGVAIGGRSLVVAPSSAAQASAGPVAAVASLIVLRHSVWRVERPALR